jgi:hypothetical protein
MGRELCNVLGGFELRPYAYNYNFLRILTYSLSDFRVGYRELKWQPRILTCSEDTFSRVSPHNKDFSSNSHSQQRRIRYNILAVRQSFHDDKKKFISQVLIVE